MGTRHRKIPPATQASCHANKRVPKRFLGIRDFPYLKLGIRDFKAKSGRDSGLTVYAGRSWGVGCQKTLGITGLKNPFGDLLRMTALCFRQIHLLSFSSQRSRTITREYSQIISTSRWVKRVELYTSIYVDLYLSGWSAK